MTNGIQLVEKFAGAVLLAFPYIACHNCDYIVIGIITNEVQQKCNKSATKFE